MSDPDLRNPTLVLSEGATEEAAVSAVSRFLGQLRRGTIDSFRVELRPAGIAGLVSRREDA